MKEILKMFNEIVFFLFEKEKSEFVVDFILFKEVFEIFDILL